MATVELTADNFNETLEKGVMVFRESGALPASALNQVIEGVRGLDMDQVRAEIAAQQAGDQQA